MTRRSAQKGAKHGTPNQENACGAGRIGLVVCRASLDMGSYAALEERAETISITSGSYYNSGAGDCDSACPAEQ